MSNEHAQYRHCTKMSIYIHYVRHVTIVIEYEITGVIDLGVVLYLVIIMQTISNVGIIYE